MALSVHWAAGTVRSWWEDTGHSWSFPPPWIWESPHAINDSGVGGRKGRLAERLEKEPTFVGAPPESLIH